MMVRRRFQALVAALLLLGAPAVRGAAEVEDAATARILAPLLSILLDDSSNQAVLPILLKWRERMLPEVAASERAAIEGFAARYPTKAPRDVEPIVMVAASGETPELSTVIGRRDWAYAVHGFAYTFAGALAQGEGWRLGVGFWAFLEAALLNPDEPEHLVNVAFHLNEREHYADARVVLARALQLNADDPAARHNLAYALAGLGRYADAASEQLRAMSQEHGYSLMLERLAQYFEWAGMPESGATYRALLEQPDQLLDVPAPPVLQTLSSDGREVLRALNDLWSEMNAAIGEFQDGLYTLFPVVGWYPPWPMSTEEATHYEQCWAPVATGNRCWPGGFDLRGLMYMESPEFHGLCRQRILAECNATGAEIPCGSELAFTRRYCRACIVDPWFEMVALTQRQSAAHVQRVQAQASFALDTILGARPRGFTLIDRAPLGASEEATLSEYWSRIVQVMLSYNYTYPRSWLEGGTSPTLDAMASGDDTLVGCLTGDLEDEARRADSIRHDYLRNLQTEAFVLCTFPVCGTVVVDAGFFSFQLDLTGGRLRMVSFSVTLSGASPVSLSAHYGWNLRQRESTVGLGVGLGLDRVLNLGVVAKYSPSSGANAVLDVGPAAPFIASRSLRLPIAKVGKFMNAN